MSAFTTPGTKMWIYAPRIPGQRCRSFPPLLPFLQEPFRCERFTQQTTPKQVREHGSVSSASAIGTANTKQIRGHRGTVSAQPTHFFGTSSRPLPASSAHNNAMESGKERHRLLLLLLLLLDEPMPHQPSLQGGKDDKVNIPVNVVEQLR
ncbi:hypothetical protein HPB50_028066 [Hyalomma asiaticum]|nr:hypothetical protein HPB50_028066 [Hyalomma asiaticum]